VGSSGKERSIHSFPKQPTVNQVRPLDCFDSPHPSLKCYSDCLHTRRHCSITARFSRTPCTARSCNSWKYCCELCGIVTPTRTTFLHAEGPQRFYLVGGLFDRPTVQCCTQSGSAKRGYHHLWQGCYCATNTSRAGFPSTGQCRQREIWLNHARILVDT